MSDTQPKTFFFRSRRRALIKLSFISNNKL
jgi:hypothetical protein